MAIIRPGGSGWITALMTPPIFGSSAMAAALAPQKRTRQTNTLFNMTSLSWAKLTPKWRYLRYFPPPDLHLQNRCLSSVIGATQSPKTPLGFEGSHGCHCGRQMQQSTTDAQKMPRYCLFTPMTVWPGLRAMEMLIYSCGPGFIFEGHSIESGLHRTASRPRSAVLSGAGCRQAHHRTARTRRPAAQRH